jgi:hypothetical protein
MHIKADGKVIAKITLVKDAAMARVAGMPFF